MKIKAIEYESEYEKAKYDFDKHEDNINRLKKELDNLNTRLEGNSILIKEYKEKYGKTYADNELLNKLSPQYMDNYSSIWMHKEFNTKRQELFLTALKVIKAFCVNSRKFKTNASLLSLALEGKLSNNDLELSYNDLLKTVAIITPVVIIDKSYISFILNYASIDDLTNVMIVNACDFGKQNAIAPLSKFKNVITFYNGTYKDDFIEIPQSIKRNIEMKLLKEESAEDIHSSFEEYLRNTDIDRD